MATHTYTQWRLLDLNTTYQNFNNNSKFVEKTTNLLYNFLDYVDCVLNDRL